MKQLMALLIGSLLSSIALGQGFPIREQTSRLATEREARPLNAVFGGTGSTQVIYTNPSYSTKVNTATELGGSTLQVVVPPGRLWEIQSVEVTADTSLQVELRIQRNSANEVGTYEAHPNVITDVRGGKVIFHFGGRFVTEGTTITPIYRIRTNSTGQSRQPYVSGSVFGKDWSNAKKPDAQSVIAFMTDSYGHTNGEPGIIGDQFFSYGVVNAMLLKDGLNVRPVVKSFGGSTLGLAYKDVNLGELNFPHDHTVFSEGFNDAKQSTSAWSSARAAFKTNYLAMIDRDFLGSSTRTATICLPYPPHNSDATRLANIADVKAAIQEVITAAQSKYPNRVFTCDFSSAYPNNDDSYYNPAETAGTGDGKVHASIKGQGVLMQLLYNAIKASGANYYNKIPKY